eukprot:TRINITY_DN7035_c0_g1_i1.p1 TRINITY_DN7035_c0_g1~~TRINITY_DN7035_c0_g1_i1.p1  ORF type:complete len:637 (-),score=150.21 TRINITY_DN7035_c0_g1_i1:172-2082(-)
MLCTEDQDSKDTGPCLEYFLQERLLDTLCALGQVDRPPGMQSLVLRTLTNLLLDIRQQLLNLMSVQVPIWQLVRACHQMAVPSARSDFVEFVVTLCVKLQTDPSLLGFYLQSSSDRASGETSHDFMALNALLPFVNETNAVGQRARDGLLCCLAYELRSPEVTQCVLSSPLCDLVIEGLATLYKELPQDLEPGEDEISGAHMLSFYNRLQFCNTICGVAAYPIAEKLVNTFRAHFLEAVLQPALGQEIETRARLATSYTRRIIQQLDSPPLLNAVVYFLLGGTREDGGESEHAMYQLLLDRMDSLDEALSLSTMQLFDSLLALHHKHVIQVLILSSLENADIFAEASESTSSSTGAEATPGRNVRRLQSIQQYMSMSPSSKLAGGGQGGEAVSVEEVLGAIGFEAYLLDAQRQTAVCLQAFDSWDNDGRDEDADVEPDLEDEHAAPMTPDGKGSAGSGAGAGDGAAGEGANGMPRRALRPYKESVFMTVLFNKLESMTNEGLEANLVLTGLFAKLAQSPHPLMDSFFLDPHLQLKEGIRSVPRVLAAVSQQVREAAEGIDRFDEKLNMLRAELSADDDDEDITRSRANSGVMGNDDDVDASHEKQFLQAVIILDEFCKELAAVIQAKETLNEFPKV